MFIGVLVYCLRFLICRCSCWLLLLVGVFASSCRCSLVVECCMLLFVMCLFVIVVECLLLVVACCVMLLVASILRRGEVCVMLIVVCGFWDCRVLVVVWCCLMRLFVVW